MCTETRVRTRYRKSESSKKLPSKITSIGCRTYPPASALSPGVIESKRIPVSRAILFSSSSTPGMSGLPGIAFVTRKRSAARIGSALGAERTASRRFWISVSVASI